MAITLHKGLTPPSGIRDRILAGDTSSWLMVVPTKRQIRHLTREYIRARPEQVAPALPLHTFETLALAVFKEFPASLRVLRGPMRTLLIYKALLSSSPSFGFFSLRNEVPRIHRGTFEKIVHVINKMKESGLLPVQLREEIHTADPDETRKLADITTIYEQYERELAAIGALDTPGVLSFLGTHCTADEFQSAFRHCFPGADTIAIAGFDEFSEPELALIARLSSLTGVGVTLSFDYQQGNPALFGHLEENYRRLVAMGFSPSGKANGQGNVNEAIHTVAGTLFARTHHVNRVPLEKNVTVVHAKTRLDEVTTVCKLVKQMIRENPERDLSRICIAMRYPGLYTALFRSAFATYGLPANITDRSTLSTSQVVMALLGLLQLQVRSFRRDDLLRVSVSPFIRSCGSDGYDPEALFTAASRLRVQAGLSAWTDALAREAAGANASNRDHTTQAVAERAHRSIGILSSLLDPFNHPLTPANFHARVTALFDQVGVRRVLATPLPGITDDMQEREIRAFAGLLATLGDVLKLVEYESGRSTRHTLGYYLEYLRVALADERYNVRERYGRGILVTSIEETRGLPVDVMIIMGLVDGEFPSVYQPEVFWSHARQERRSQRYAWEHRYLFYQAISNFTEHLYLTHPEMEEDVELVPSSFINALDEVASVAHVGSSDIIPADTAYSRVEFLMAKARDQDGLNTGGEDKPPADDDELSHIRRSIRVERSRMQTHLLGAHEGRISATLSPSTRRRLDDFRERVYSISQLESYGRCPFQFFSQRVLRLREFEERDETLTPLERGDILHEVLFLFFLSRRDRGLPSLQGCTDEELNAAARELIALAEDRFNTLDIPDPFWDLEKEVWLGRDGIGGVLREFLEYERHRTTAIEPAFFEVAFGPGMVEGGRNDRMLSTPQPVPAGRLRLRGKVDRVETGPGVFVIVDYKTGGSLPKLDSMRAGMSLQLPLYLHAIEYLLQSKGENSLQPAAGLYYQLRNRVELVPGIANKEHRGSAYERTSRSRQVLQNDAELRLFIQECIQRAESYVDGIVAGNFPLTTPDKMEKVCSYCTFNTMCRVQSAHHISPKKEEQHDS